MYVGQGEDEDEDEDDDDDEDKDEEHIEEADGHKTRTEKRAGHAEDGVRDADDNAQHQSDNSDESDSEAQIVTGFSTKHRPPVASTLRHRFNTTDNRAHEPHRGSMTNTKKGPKSRTQSPEPVDPGKALNDKHRKERRVSDPREEAAERT